MNEHRRAITRAATLSIAIVAPLFLTQSAHAIPSFARKYETSCQTCHTAYPSLTPFGEAFRRNGYRFPEGQDEERSEDEPTALGHEVHREMWPDEVWPGEIPGGVPIAVSMTAAAAMARGEAGHAHGAEPAVTLEPTDEPPWGVGFADSSLALLTGGTLGERISFFGKVEVSGHGEVLLERPHVIISPLRAPLWMIRIGAFEPTLHAFSVHRSLTGHNLAFSTVSLGDNGWSPEPEQIGIEATGVSYHRVGWTVGVVEGAGNRFNRDKDVYGRLEVKLGGMSLDGYEPSGYNRPWQDLSLGLGGSFYRGVATFGTGADQSDAFWRASVDLKATLVDATITLAAARQHDQRPVFLSQEDGQLDSLLAEVDYVVWPWFIPVLRYEIFRQELLGLTDAGQRGTVGIAALLRSNISIRMLAKTRRHPGADIDLEELSLEMQTAF